MERILAIQTDSSKSLRGLSSSPAQHLCFAVCYEDGLVHTIDLGPPGQETSSQKPKASRTKPKARVVACSQGRNEVYVGNEDGTVFIFKASDMDAPICIFFEFLMDNQMTMKETRRFQGSRGGHLRFKGL